jgi:hypothetical protein
LSAGLPQVCCSLPYSNVTELMVALAARRAEKVAVSGKFNVTWSSVTSRKGAASASWVEVNI